MKTNIKFLFSTFFLSSISFSNDQSLDSYYESYIESFSDLEDENKNIKTNGNSLKKNYFPLTDIEIPNPTPKEKDIETPELTQKEKERKAEEKAEELKKIAQELKTKVKNFSMEKIAISQQTYSADEIIGVYEKKLKYVIKSFKDDKKGETERAKLKTIFDSGFLQWYKEIEKRYKDIVKNTQKGEHAIKSGSLLQMKGIFNEGKLTHYAVLDGARGETLHSLTENFLKEAELPESNQEEILRKLSDIYLSFGFTLSQFHQLFLDKSTGKVEMSTIEEATDISKYFKTIVHGDFHLGNTLYNQINSKFYLIDIESMYQILTEEFKEPQGNQGKLELRHKNSPKKSNNFLKKHQGKYDSCLSSSTEKSPCPLNRFTIMMDISRLFYMEFIVKQFLSHNSLWSISNRKKLPDLFVTFLYGYITAYPEKERDTLKKYIFKAFDLGFSSLPFDFKKIGSFFSDKQVRLYQNEIKGIIKQIEGKLEERFEQDKLKHKN